MALTEWYWPPSAPLVIFQAETTGSLFKSTIDAHCRNIRFYSQNLQVVLDLKPSVAAIINAPDGTPQVSTIFPVDSSTGLSRTTRPDFSKKGNQTPRGHSSVPPSLDLRLPHKNRKHRLRRLKWDCTICMHLRSQFNVVDFAGRLDIQWGGPYIVIDIGDWSMGISYQWCSLVNEDRYDVLPLN